MRIKLFFKKTVWIILLTGCVSMPAQTEVANSDLATPPANMLTAPNVTTFVTFTPTTQPTLLPAERESVIKKLMATNGGCRLPCFWGIIPGVTDWGNTANFLENIHATVGNIEESPGTNYHAVIFKDEYLTSGDNFGFLETLNVVDVILANGNLSGSTTRDAKDFASLWALYSPREIISEYGVPSRVLLTSVFAIGYGDTGKHGYILWVFYDHLGFMIRYDGTVADLPVYHICPQLQDGVNITRIGLILQSPSNSSPLESYDSILAENIVPRVILPIEDAAGINNEEFYNLFTKKDSQHCFDTPREIWRIK